MDKEKELKKLLAEERVRSNHWRVNYQGLKDYHLKLQEDYLASKGELKSVLEATKQLKEAKDEELQQVKDQLEKKLKELDFYLNELKEKEKFEEAFKEKCRQELDEFSAKAKRDVEFLKMENMRLTGDRGMLKQRLEHLEQEIEIKLRNLVLEHQNELAGLGKERDDLRAQFKEAKKHPDYERMLKLTGENQELKAQIASLRELVDDADENCRKLNDEQQRLIDQQNAKLKKQEAKLADAEQECERQKQEVVQLKGELAVLDGQLKALRNSLKDEQCARESLVQQHSSELKRKLKEKDDLRQLLKEEKIKCELEIDKLKQEKKSGFYLPNGALKLLNECVSVSSQLIALARRSIGDRRLTVRLIFHSLV